MKNLSFLNFIICLLVTVSCSKNTFCPKISNLKVNSISRNGAKVDYSVNLENGLILSKHGVCWSEKNKLPTNLDNCEYIDANAGDFSKNLNNLKVNTKYYVRVYSFTNDNLECYSKEVISFNTQEVGSIGVTLIGVYQVSGNVRASLDIFDNGGKIPSEIGVCWAIGKIPTIDDNKSSTINSSRFIDVIAKGLEVEKEYQFRAYAINDLGISYSNVLKITLERLYEDGIKGEVSDIQGNIYKTKEIGKQTWFVENLKATLENNGKPISFKNFAFQSRDSSTVEKFGVFYSYNTVKDNRVCPVGWHIPTLLEWEELINFLGGYNEAGGKMKSLNSIEPWKKISIPGNNKSGFSAVPAGYMETCPPQTKFPQALYYEIGVSANFWSRNFNTADELGSIYLKNSELNIQKRKISNNWCEYETIRCIKD